MTLLNDQVVFITGGTGGQGRAHALASAAQGADVVLADVPPVHDEAYADIVREVERLGRRAISVQADVTEQASLDRAVQTALDHFGRIDSVIANAGIWRGGFLWEMPESEWQRVLDVNLSGVWRTLKAVAPSMIEREHGSIVLISSVDAFDAEDESTAYGVSKVGVLGLLKYAAYELGTRGVRVNAIAPGFVDTPMVNTQQWYDALAGGAGGTRADLIDYAHSFNQLKGVGLLDPSDIADTAVYLNSPLAKHVTGATIPVDAGHLLVHRVNTTAQR